METELKNAGIRVTYDKSDTSSGKKFYYWEMKGVPLRIEIGPKDIEKGQICIVRRDIADKNERKIFAPRDDVSLLNQSNTGFNSRKLSRYGEGCPKGLYSPVQMM